MSGDPDSLMFMLLDENEAEEMLRRKLSFREIEELSPSSSPIDSDAEA